MRIFRIFLLGIFVFTALGLRGQDFEWAKSFGGTSTDVGTSIRIDAAGNVYSTGSFQGTVDFDPGAGTANLTSTGSEDIFLQKLDASGNFLWAKSLGSSSFDVGNSIAVDTSGNVYTTGVFSGTVDFDPGVGIANLTSAGQIDIFVQKLDSLGNLLWAKSFGGFGFDVGQSVTVDNSGNVYITGWFGGTVDFDPGAGTANLTSSGSNDIFVQKLDASGNYIWAKSFGSTSGDEGRSVTVDPLGNVYTTGNFRNTVDFDPGAGTTNLTSAGGDDAFVQKLDASGNFLWAHTFGSTSGDEGASITVDALGNVYTTGYFEGTIDFDPGAGTSNLTSAGVDDVFVQKLDASGNYLWAKTFGGISNDIGSSIMVDASGNVYTTGTFRNSADFNPGAGTANLSTTGNLDPDVFVQKLDSLGNYAWAYSFGSSLIDVVRSIALDALGNVYTTGNFQGTVDFDPGPAIANLTSAGSEDIFVHKMSQCTNSGSQTETACDSYTWPANGQNYTTSGTYTTTLTNTAGCDSVVTLNLTINNSNTGTETLTACDTYTWLANGQTYTTSGTHTATLSNAAGCDSVVTLNLTINNSSSGTETITACDSFTWPANGQTYTSSGTQTTTLTNAAGCDSVVTLNLTINNSATSSFSEDICSGDTYIFGTQTLSSAGTYTEVFTRPNGCDSTVTLTLNVTTIDTSVTVTNNTLTSNATGASYQWLDCDNGNAPIPGETNQTFTATQSGNYAVMVTENNCSDTSGCFNVIVVGLKVSSGSEIRFYPNPTSGKVMIEMEEAHKTQISILDQKGATLKSFEMNGNQMELDLGDLPSAKYFIQIQGEGVDFLKGIIKN